MKPGESTSTHRLKARMERLRNHHNKCLSKYASMEQNIQEMKQHPFPMDTDPSDVPQSDNISVKKRNKKAKPRKAAAKSKIKGVKPALETTKVLKNSQDAPGDPTSMDADHSDILRSNTTNSVLKIQEMKDHPFPMDTDPSDVPQSDNISVKKRYKKVKPRKAAAKSKIKGVKPALETTEVLKNSQAATKNQLSMIADDASDAPPLERTESVFLSQEYLDKVFPNSEEVVPDSDDDSLSLTVSSGSKYSPSKQSLREESTEESGHVTDAIFNEAAKSKKIKKYRKRKGPSTSKESESEDNDGSNDEPVKKMMNISIMKLQKKKDGARVYSKRHFCLYCSSVCHKMSRHLTRRHVNERDVAKALSFPVKSKERKLQFDIIRNNGDRAHNFEVLKTGSGTLVPGKQTDAPVKASDYMHCINCAALLKRKALWRHMSRCRLSQKAANTKPGKGRIQSLCSFAQPVPDGVSRKVWELVNCMHQDEVTSIIRQEKSIMRLGEHLYLKHGHDKSRHEYIRQKMREVGRLIKKSQEAGKLKTIEDFFVPSNFNCVIEAVRNVSGFNEDKNMYKTPSLALKLGHSLKKIADILECDAKMEKCVDEHFIENIQRSRMLYEKKWDVCVSSRALQTLREAKWNTPQLLPFTEDVRAMHAHIETRRSEYQQNLKDEPNKKNWSKLAKLTLCEVILFNRRREGEVSKMQLSAFTLRNQSGIHSDLALGLSELEQKLCQHFQRIEIMGKRNRKVPLLLTPEMITSMEMLVEQRLSSSVSSDNPYFFSRPEADTYFRGSDAIRQIAKDCGAKHPETLSSTKLRKQISTLSTVLNLKDHEMDILANFLGHDIRIHREYYRLPEGTLELAKVSKVLLALEQGRLSDFKGKGLDQIQIDPNEKVVEAEDSDLSETEERLETTSQESTIQGDQQNVGPEGGHQAGVNHAGHSNTALEKTSKPNDDSPKSVRRPWSADEVRAVEKTLMSFIQEGNVPGKYHCTACIEASPKELQNRTWSGIKFYINNRIQASARKSAKRAR